MLQSLGSHHSPLPKNKARSSIKRTPTEVRRVLHKQARLLSSQYILHSLSIKSRLVLSQYTLFSPSNRRLFLSQSTLPSLSNKCLALSNQKITTNKSWLKTMLSAKTRYY